MPFTERYDALLVANGSRPTKSRLKSLLRRSDRLIAVDGGLNTCRKYGFLPQVVIGDLDSALDDAVAWATRSGAAVVRRPNQDATDLEKALHYCRVRKWKRIAVIAASGDRPDHYLNGLELAFRVPRITVHFYAGGMAVIPLRGRASFTAELTSNQIVSWLGFPEATGCTLTGVKWPFRSRTLRAGTFQSVSNRSVGGIVATQRRGSSLLMVGL